MKKLYGTQCYVQSVGVKNDLEIDGFAIAACSEMGVQLDRHRSRSFDEMDQWGDDLSSFDLVLALSPASQRRALDLTQFYHLDVEYWPILDPTELGETRVQRLESYRQARDQIVNNLILRFGPPTEIDEADLDQFRQKSRSFAATNYDGRKWQNEVMTRITELEEFIAPIVSAQSMIGHNNPPDDIVIDEPFTRSDWLDLNETVDSIQSMVETSTANSQEAMKSERVLVSKLSKLGSWLAARLAKGVDAALVAVGTAFGAAIVIDPTKLAGILEKTVQALEKWISHLPIL